MWLSIILLGGISGTIAAITAITILGVGILGAILTYGVVGTAVVIGWVISKFLESPNDHFGKPA